MNWISALDNLQWVLLGLVPPLILMLYFLKLRRTPVEVPSTYLWTRAIEDLHVNSIWQRLRNSLLLLLQLLFAFLLLLACLRPGCPGEELAGLRFIFLIDQSASMSAVDAGENGNLSRLEEAKKQVGNMIDRMKPNDAAMIICFSDRANVVQSYTKNQSLLKRKLKGIRQTHRATDMKEALVAATGLANPGRTSQRDNSFDVQVAEALEAKLFIFSDGGVAEMPDVSLGPEEQLKREYFPIGGLEPPRNIGITAFSISDADEAENMVQAFASLQNSDDEDHVVGVTLYADGEIFDANANVLVEKESETRLKFDLRPLLLDIVDPIKLRLEIDEKDVYDLDNRAYAVLNPPRRAAVLVVTESNRFLEFALNTTSAKALANVDFQPPAYLEDKQFQNDASLGVYDLIIFDQVKPAEMPLCNTVFIGVEPPSPEWNFGEPQSPTAVLDSNQAHPLMYSVSLGNVTIIDSFPIQGPQGVVSLIESTGGPIVAMGTRGGFEDLVIGFPFISFNDEGEATINTDWTTSLGFPLFVRNVLRVLGGGDAFKATLQQKPGKIVTLRPQLPVPKVSVKAPDKSQTELTARSDNSFTYSNTEDTGIYEVIEPETRTVDQMFAVNLMDRRESDLTVRESLEIGFEEVQGQTSAYKPARKEYWPWIIGAALAILMIEWVIYNRRVFI